MQKHCLYVQVHIFLTRIAGLMQKEEPLIHMFYNQLKECWLSETANRPILESVHWTKRSFWKSQVFNNPLNYTAVVVKTSVAARRTKLIMQFAEKGQKKAVDEESKDAVRPSQTIRMVFYLKLGLPTWLKMRI